MLEKSIKEAKAIAKKIAAELKGLNEVTFHLGVETILASGKYPNVYVTVTLWFGESFSREMRGICADAGDVKILAIECRRVAEERLAKILELAEKSRGGEA